MSQKNLNTNFFITEIRNEDKVKEMVIPLAKSIKRELLYFTSNQVRWKIIDVSFNFFFKVGKVKKVLMAQYTIDKNRTLPHYVIQNEITKYKMPISVTSLSALFQLYRFENDEILFEPLLEFIEAVITDDELPEVYNTPSLE